MPDARDVLDEVARRLEEAADRTRPIPAASAPEPHRRVTVGMVPYDDFNGAFFTVEAIRLYHAELSDDVGFVVVDNHPESATAEELKRLDRKVPGYRYVPFRGHRGTAVRDLVFREARSDHVVCVDAHVLLRPGALAALVAHLDEHPDDLVHGPLLHEDGTLRATHLEEGWKDGRYGQRACDLRAVDPQHPAFEIEMSELSMFACRRDAWPGLNPRFRGSGGEEGYLHEKFRRRAGRVVCLPAAGYVRRVARPRGATDPDAWGDRIRNHLIGWRELALDTRPVVRHFRKLLGRAAADPLIGAARDEVDNPLSFFDGIFCLQLDDHADEWPDVHRRFEALGVGRMVERFPAIRTPESHHRGCALSHRAMVGEAKRRGLGNVLVLEEDVIFLDDTLAVLRRALDDLRGLDWDLLYLGGLHHKLGGARTSPVPGSDVLEIPHFLTASHGVAYNHTSFDRILAEVPPGGDEFEVWLAEYLAIDRYLPRRAVEGAFRAFVTTPRVASQPVLTTWAKADGPLADRYTIR